MLIFEFTLRLFLGYWLNVFCNQVTITKHEHS